MLTRIVSPEEERERASKALSLNGGPDYSPRLLAASTKPKPTVKVKRLVPTSASKLKGGSIIPGHGALGNQSFQEHIASCEICRSVYEVQTSRAQKKSTTQSEGKNGIVLYSAVSEGKERFWTITHHPDGSKVM